MAYAEKHIYLDELMAIGPARVSAHLMSLQMGMGRNDVNTSAVEDHDDTHGKGSYTGTLTGRGASLAAWLQWLQSVASDTGAVPLIRFPTADIRLVTPVAPGDLALLGVATVHAAPLEGGRGELLTWNLEASPQTPWYLGDVLHSNVKAAAIAASGNGTGLQLGTLGAGQELIVAVSVLDPPGVGGAGTVTFALESDADAGFATPVTRWTSKVISGPDSDYTILDGDVAPSGVDDRWRLKWTRTGTLTFTIMAAMAIATSPGL